MIWSVAMSVSQIANNEGLLDMKEWPKVSEADLEAHRKLDEQEEAFQQKQDAAARAMGFLCDSERMEYLIQEQDRKL